MQGINKVILVGTLGADPEVRYSAKGTAFATISLATNESWTDKQSGEKQEHTEWHRVVLSGRLAEVAGEYLKKGSKVYFEGKNNTRKWQDNNGVDKYTTEVRCFTMQMLDSRSDNGGQGGGQQNRGGGQQNQNQNRNQNQGGGQQNSGGGAPAGGQNFDQFDDDIPFR